MNYNTHFGFSEPPFQDVPDQRFLFLTEKHEELLAELVDFISTRQGVAAVIGDDGIGKTMLVAALMQRLPQSFHPILIIRPAADPMALMVEIARAMGITIVEENLVNLTPLADAVYAAAREGKFFVVLLDDAHLLTDRHLEEIRLLDQMELHGQHLLPLVLVGREGLDQKLGGHANQRHRQLIATKLSVSCLTAGETIRYIDHRLRQVGSSFEACFAEDCSDQLFATTGGIPRRINQVCHQALERGRQENQFRVTREMLWGEGPAPRQKTQKPPQERSLSTKIGALAGVALVVSLTGYAILTGLADQTSLPDTYTSVSPLQTLPETPREESSPSLVTAPPHTSQNQAGREPASQPAPPITDLQTSLQPKVPQELAEAMAASGPQTDPQAAETVRSTSAVTYRVTDEDSSLTEIVARYYPFNKKIGFVAIILANPQINQENLIYPGMDLLLPKVNKTDNVIALKDNRHYLLYNRYVDVSIVNKIISMLKERQVRFLLRETRHPDAGQVYRIFLGGYEREEDLKQALMVVEGK